MSITNPVLTEKKFAILRQRLDHLGYLQTLGIESFPLVERLFADLVQTIDNLRKLKKENCELNLKCDTLELAVEPFKAENGKLLAENNKLQHQRIIQKEKSEAAVRQHKLSVKKLEEENNDLRFLNTQYLLKVKSLETESQEKSEKILLLQEKNSTAIIETKSGKKQQLPFRRQRLEISSPPPSMVKPYTLSQVQNQCKDVYVADLLRVADGSMDKLRNQIESLTNKLNEMETERETLKSQVDVRNLEIKRLGKLLETGRPLEAVVTNTLNGEKEELILQLKLQINYLEEQNSQLSKEMSKKLDTNRVKFSARPGSKVKPKFDLHNKNETEKKTMTKEKRFEEELWEQLKESKKKCTTLEIEVNKLKKAIAEMHTSQSSQESEQAKIEVLLQEVNKDKEKLANRVKELVANERELLLEIDRLNRNSTNHSGEKTTSDTLDSLMEYAGQLETQRDRYKEEARALIRLLQTSRGKDSAEPSTKVDSAMLKLLDEERNFYKKQYHELLEEQMSKGRRRAPSGCVSTVDKGVTVTDAELGEVTNSKGDLENYIQALQEKLNENQVTINVLLQEKDSLIAQCTQANQDIMRLQNSLMENEHRVHSADSIDHALAHLQSENDQLTHQLQSLSSENDSLRNDVVSLEAQLNQVKQDLSHYQTETNKMRTEEAVDTSQLLEELNQAVQRVEELKENNKVLAKDYQDIEARLLNENLQLKERICELEAIKSLPEEISLRDPSTQPKGRLSTLETEVIGLQYDVKHGQNDIQNLQRKLAESDEKLLHLKQLIEGKEEALSMARAVNLEQNQKLDELERLIDRQTTEIENLRAMIQSLGLEKDYLTSDQMQRDHQVAGLEQHLISKTSESREMQENLSSMEIYAEDLRKTISEKDSLLKKLNEQLETAKLEERRLEDEQDAMRRENRRLLEDLTTVTVQHQRVGEELDAVSNEKATLQRQIQEYVTEVSRVQELLSLKDQERLELLQQYQHLSEEHDILEIHSKELETQNTSVTHILIGKDSELRQCQETILSLEQEIHEHMDAQNSYSDQMRNLNDSVVGLESELEHTRRESGRLKQELASTSDVCKALENTNNRLQQQFQTGENDKQKLSSRLLDVQEEMVQLREHLTASRSSVVNLETLLVSCREKEFKQQLTYQEMNAELEHFKTRLKETEEKIEKQCGETANYKSQLSKIEMDLEKTKRQLTNERFEKERINQELKRFRQQHQCSLQTELTHPFGVTVENPVTTTTGATTSLFVSNNFTQTVPKMVGSSTAFNSSRIAATFGPTGQFSGESESSLRNTKKQ